MTPAEEERHVMTPDQLERGVEAARRDADGDKARRPSTSTPAKEVETKGPRPEEKEAPRSAAAGNAWAAWPAKDRPPFKFAALSTNGLLWLINRVAFHPRGFALALEYPHGAPREAIEAGEVEPLGWRLIAADDEIHFDLPEGMERDSFLNVEHLLDVARRHAVAEALTPASS